MSITRNDLKKYPKPVADCLLKGLKENPALRVRALDGTHLRIYDGNRNEQPFKIAANRPAKPVLEYLEPWLEARKPNPQPLPEVETSREEEAPVAIDITETEIPAPDGFTWENGLFKCIHCNYARRNRMGLHLHRDVHTEEGKRRRAENAKKGGRTRAKKTQASLTVAKDRRQITVDSLSALIDALNLPELKQDNAEIEALRAENAELKARLDLLNEAFKGLK